MNRETTVKDVNNIQIRSSVIRILKNMSDAVQRKEH